jgi:hypothetical protein
VVASVDLGCARRVLRHRSSRRYLRDGGWTGDVDMAKEFQSIRQAVEVCLEQELSEVDLVLCFDGAFLEITVKVR